MLDKIMTALGFSSLGSSSEDDYSTRRTYPRRPNDKCVSVVNGKVLPVLDWSPGGVRVFADTRPINVGDEMDVIMKFQIRDQLIDVPHRAHVVRKANDNFALQFLPLTADMRRTFTEIIDNFNADAFAASQA